MEFLRRNSLLSHLSHIGQVEKFHTPYNIKSFYKVIGAMDTGEQNWAWTLGLGVWVIYLIVKRWALDSLIIFQFRINFFNVLISTNSSFWVKSEKFLETDEATHPFFLKVTSHLRTYCEQVYAYCKYMHMHLIQNTENHSSYNLIILREPQRHLLETKFSGARILILSVESWWCRHPANYKHWVETKLCFKDIAILKSWSLSYLFDINFVCS